MNFLYTYSPAWIFLIAVLAFTASFWLYYRSKQLAELPRTWLWILGIFRFLTLFSIGVLLLGIILEKLDNQSQKPIVFVMHDLSESIVQTKDSAFYKTDYLAALEKLSSDLQAKYEVVKYGFSNQLSSSFDSTYNYKITNISKGLNQVYDQYANRNVGAVILSTDGIFNEGQNPIYTVERKTNVPIFTVGLGDTTIAKDLLIESVVSNDVAFLGNEFPVQIDVVQNGFDRPQIKVDLISSSGSKQSETVKLKAGEKEINVNFQLSANKIGYQKYTVSISQLDGEFTYKNNRKNFYVNVIDARQKILLTYGYTHPDVSALNYVITNNKNYELTVKPIGEIKEALSGFDLVIVHNFMPTSSALNKLILSNETPVLNIVGVNADFKKLVKANIGLTGNGDKTEDISFEPNVNFKDIIFDPKVLKMLTNAPPLTAPQGNVDFSASVKAIAFQKIGSITLSKPLIYTNQKGDNKYAVILGEGIWRWRLFDQMQNETTDNFANFLSQIITYLAVKENKDPFKVNIENEYEESKQVIVRAELYNASYQLTTEAEVEFKLTDETGKVFNYVFFKTNDSFVLELGRLKQGIYEWEAKTAFEKNRYKKKGSFVVKEAKKELLNLSADHRLLNNLSLRTNGQFYLPRKLEKLKTDLLNREDIVPITYQEKSFDDLIDYKWLFVLIFIFLTVEWFIRKFQGGY